MWSKNFIEAAFLLKHIAELNCVARIGYINGQCYALLLSNTLFHVLLH